MMFGKRPNPVAVAPPPKAAPTGEASDEASLETEAIWTPTTARSRKTVEQLLLERGHVNEEQLTQARNVQQQTPGKSLAQILLTMNSASEAQILSALAETLNLAFETPDKSTVEEAAFNLLSADYIRKQQVIPLRMEDKKLIVGMATPTNVFLVDELRRRLKRDIKVVVCTPADINKVVEQITSGTSDVQVDDIIKDMAEDDVQVIKDSDEDVADLEKRGRRSAGHPLRQLPDLRRGSSRAPATSTSSRKRSSSRFATASTAFSSRR